MCLLCICSIGLNSSNNKVVYEWTLLQYICTLYYYMHVYFLFAAHDDWLVHDEWLGDAASIISLCRNTDIRYGLKD